MALQSLAHTISFALGNSRCSIYTNTYSRTFVLAEIPIAMPLVMGTNTSLCAHVLVHTRFQRRVADVTDK